MIPRNRPPVHPGEVLLEEFLKPMGMSQAEFARHLGGTWTQPKVNALCREKRGITEEIALDLGDALGTSPEFWLNLQLRHNLWFALQAHNKIRKIKYSIHQVAA